jgi:hypothetical protein
MIRGNGVNGVFWFDDIQTEVPGEESFYFQGSTGPMVKFTFIVFS